MTEETADAWLEAWEVKAAEDGLERGAAYWDSGWSWIAEQRQHRVRPRSGSAAAEEARLLNPQIGSRASVSAHS